MLRFNSLVIVSIAVLAFVAAPVAAQSLGQSDLDKATDLQLNAKSMADLGKVADLAESAIKKGLEKDEEPFAKQLLMSALYKRAARLSNEVLERRPPNPRWPQIRQAALNDLERAVRFHESLPDAFMLISRLNSLPGGDEKRARQAIDKAISLWSEDKSKKSSALVHRARLEKDVDKKLADVDTAIELDAGNTGAWELRAAIYVSKGKLDKALEDFESILKRDEKNITARLAVAETLANMQKLDEALKHVNKAIELQPEMPIAYRMRARVHILKEDAKGALDDLDEALRLQPGDLQSLLLRAGLRHDQDDARGAKDDVNRVLQVAPGLTQAIILRSMISAAEGKYTDAIGDIEKLLKADPKNAQWRMQLAAFYAADKRPRKAIEVFTSVVEDEPENWLALRSRADTLLSVGKHADAIADYEKAVKLKPDNSGILNNLAWVLATSPNDSVRDGKRAVELATEACEVSEYKAPHILSTLGAAYAEAGDFDTAIKWSSKAVELGKEQENNQVGQLQEELDSYKNKKPWREKQEVKEKPAPIIPSGKVVET